LGTPSGANIGRIGGRLILYWGFRLVGRQVQAICSKWSLRRRAAAVPHRIGKNGVGAGEHCHGRIHRREGASHNCRHAGIEARATGEMAAIPAAIAGRVRAAAGISAAYNAPIAGAVFASLIVSAIFP